MAMKSESADNHRHCNTTNLSYSGMKELDEEIAHIKESNAQFSAIQDTDDSSAMIVCIQPDVHFHVQLKIEVNSRYPACVPIISVISDHLSKSNQAQLQRLLELKAMELICQPMLLVLVRETEAFINTCGVSGCKSPQKSMAKAKSTRKKDKITRPESSETQEAATDREVIHKQKKGKEKKKKKEFDPADISDENIDDSVEQDGMSTTASPGVTICDPDDRNCKRPTHFIAMRIHNEDIVQGLEDIQQELIEKEPLLEKGKFAKETFHLTLCTVGLDTPDAVLHCISTLEKIEFDLKSLLPLKLLTIYGMSQFYNRAIFAKVHCEEDLIKFRQILRTKLLESGVEIRDERENFTPHLTIFKVKRPERKLFGNRNIKPSIYSHVVDKTFGYESLEALYLCCMDGQRQEDGFYNTLHELRFTG